MITVLFAAALLAVAPASAVTIPGFHSPSGNIKCLFVPGGGGRLLCQIGHANYSQTLQDTCMTPSGGGVDWHGFLLTPAGKGQPSCSGGILYNPSTQHPSYANLPYGQTWKRGAFTCVSRTAGVTCTNAKGHGLFISRESWRSF